MPLNWEKLKAELIAKGGIRNATLMARMPLEPPPNIVTGISPGIYPVMGEGYFANSPSLKNKQQMTNTPFQIESTVDISASVWNENGDHPDDYVSTTHGFEHGEPREFSGEYRKEQKWEGGVVRYYRHPGLSGNSICVHCGKIMHDHGWIEDQTSPLFQLDSQVVCPGDVILTTVLEPDEKVYSVIKYQTLMTIFPMLPLS